MHKLWTLAGQDRTARVYVGRLWAARHKVDALFETRESAHVERAYVEHLKTELPHCECLLSETRQALRDVERDFDLYVEPETERTQYAEVLTDALIALENATSKARSVLSDYADMRAQRRAFAPRPDELELVA